MPTRSPLCLFLVNHSSAIEPGSTTSLLIAGMVERDHRVFVANVDGLGVNPEDRVCARARQAHASGEHSDEARMLILEPGDLVVIRTNPARDLPGPIHTLALDILAMAQGQGVIVVNDPSGLRRASSKLYTHAIPARMRPRTLVSRDPSALQAFVEDSAGPSVLKPVVGTRGADVFKVGPGEPNLNQIIEVLTRGGMAMAQSFVPEATKGDVRVLMLDGAVLEVDGASALVRRVPSGRDFRSNVHVGAVPAPADYTPALREIVDTVGPILARDGLSLCGLDVIGSQVVEINVFSPGGVQDASSFYGVNFVLPILAFLEHRLETSSPA